MLVAHADQVTNESTEAFILRIYTSQKQRRDHNHCFIKAFSDSPEGLLSGFSKIDKTLKALQVRQLYLYPRFHHAVREDLDEEQPFSSNPNGTPIVEELYQTLSPNMQECQNAIVAAVQTCMRELKAATPFCEWTSAQDDLSIENCVMSNFDMAVKRQLDQDWHRLKPQTKQLVADLSQLRRLFQALIQYDSVGFWKFINAIQSNSAAARHPSMWLLTPSADRLFRKAKERMYKIEKGIPTQQVPNPVSRLIPVLEENPKWRLLRTVLDEIKERETKDKQQNSSSQEQFTLPATILVLVKEPQSVDRLAAYLVDGRDRTLAKTFLQYLEQYNDRTRSVANKTLSEESRLLLEEEQRVRNFLRRTAKAKKVQPAEGEETTTTTTAAEEEDSSKKRAATKLNAIPSYIRKRRRVALESGRGRATGSREDLERQAVLEEAVEQTEYELYKSASSRSDGHLNIADTDLDDDEIYDTMFKASFPQEPRIVIKSFSSFEGDAGMVLADLNPKYVVMYDMNIALVRTLEIHAAVNPSTSEDDRLRIYLLMYEASAEQKVFQKTLEREQSAFVRLIHHKKTMPPPVLHVEGTQEMQQAMKNGSVGSTYADGTLPLAFDTRRGQGKVTNKEKRDIAVDVREFRSALPSILHQGGMRLAPVTLTVGDFVLSNVHCIERKSISDLFGSFASGRLYTQAEAMSKYYKCPALLIEFDPTKTFCLQNSNELGTDIKTDSACSKMVLLTRHFPKLRILWSKSPQDTLKIFKELKSTHDEVDVEKAVEIGRKDSVEALLDKDGDEDEINEAARDMLLRLPGVNVHNARRIMRECDSLADLIKMNRTELRRIAGPVAGQKLFTFFSQNYASAT